MEPAAGLQFTNHFPPLFAAKHICRDDGRLCYAPSALFERAAIYLDTYLLKESRKKWCHNLDYLGICLNSQSWQLPRNQALHLCGFFAKWQERSTNESGGETWWRNDLYAHPLREQDNTHVAIMRQSCSVLRFSCNSQEQKSLWPTCGVELAGIDFRINSVEVCTHRFNSEQACTEPFWFKILTMSQLQFSMARQDSSQQTHFTAFCHVERPKKFPHHILNKNWQNQLL